MFWRRPREWEDLDKSSLGFFFVAASTNDDRRVDMLPELNFRKKLGRRGCRSDDSSLGRVVSPGRLLHLENNGRELLELGTSSASLSGTVPVVMVVAALNRRDPARTSPPSSPPAAFFSRKLLGTCADFMSAKEPLRETFPFSKLAWNLFCCSLARQLISIAAAKGLSPVS